MSVNSLNTFLNVKDSHLRVVSGNVYATAMNIGGINIDVAHGLQSVTNQGNVTSNTLQFANATTAFVTTANVTVGRDLTVTGNATVSSNLTVTGNALISDDLTVTENLLVSNNLTVTGNLNVATIMSDSNVVAEYTGPHDRPLRKYPEVELDVNAMTSPGVGGYIVAHSGRYSTPFAGWTVFGEEFTTTNAEATSGAWIDGNPGSYAKETADAHDGVVGSITTAVQTAGTLKLASNTPVGAWISLELPTSIKLQRIEMRARLQHASETDLNEVALQSFPREFGIWGYDGSSWILLKSVTGHSANSAFGYTPTHVNATTAYNKYAIVVTRTNAVGGSNSDDRNFAAIGQLYFYGHEEGSASLDTTLKSVYNVPATTGTQLEVYYDAKDLTTMPSTVTDLAGGDQNGTVTGHSPTLDNNSFVFDGTGDYIESTLTNDSGAWIFSKSLWFKQTVEPTNLSCMSSIGDYSVSDATFFYLHRNHILISIYSSGAYFPREWVVNEWTHAVAVMKGTTSSINDIELYINGKKVEATSQFGTATTRTLPTNAQLRVGREVGSGTSYFNGSIANFRLYSKALNAGQVQELYDYQKDYFLGSKSQVTLYKGHLGVGVTEPSGQLELAGDERIQEYPPRALTGYSTHIEGHGVFKVEGDTFYTPTNPDLDPWRAFDDNISGNNRWRQANSQFTAGGGPIDNRRYAEGLPNASWLVLHLPYDVNLKGYSICPQNGQSPENIQIWGSNNGGTSWSHLHTQTQTEGDNTSYQNYTISHEGYYSIIAYLILTLTPSTATEASIRDMKFFGTPGPTTLDKGSLSLTRSLDVPRISRYDVDTETPRPEKLLVDFDTTVNSSPTDISGQGNHGTFGGSAYYSGADKAFILANNPAAVSSASTHYIRAELNNSETGNQYHSVSLWFKVLSGQNSSWRAIFECGEYPRSGNSDISLYVPGGDDKLVFAHGGSSMYSDTLTNLYFQWHHVVLTYDGANRKMYLDGELIKTQATTSWAGVANMTLHFGKNNGTNGNEGCDCHVSNFKLFWQTALEPSEVKKLYNLGRTGRSMVISDTAVGIGKVPEAQLDVRGNLNVSSFVKYDSAWFYANDGDSSGTGTFNNYTGFVPWNVLQTGSKHFTTASASTSGGYYTAPVDGIYHFDTSILNYPDARSGISGIYFSVNDSTEGETGINSYGYNRKTNMPGQENMNASATFRLSEGDTVKVYVTNMDCYTQTGHAFFSGYLVTRI